MIPPPWDFFQKNILIWDDRHPLLDKESYDLKVLAYME